MPSSTKKNHLPNTPLKVVHIEKPLLDHPMSIPSSGESVQAGFPSPAENHIERELDLNQLVIKHPAATFFIKVEGESMCDANIHTGDILVVDRSIRATSGKIIIAVLDGEFTVKRLITNKTETFLSPENSNYQKIEITPETNFQIWGVVTYVIHKAC